MSDAPRTVVITGGLGNLGTKLCRHLLSQNDGTSPKSRVVLLEHPDFLDRPLSHPDALLLPCDLGGPPSSLDSLSSSLRGADALVHFSAVNPYPNATWSECAQSMDHTFVAFHLAVRLKIRRVVFASSNHVMGGYKDDPTCGPSDLKPDLEPRVGTPNPDPAAGDAVAYAAAKLAGERLAMALGGLHAPETTFVALRIGWCQPGENLPDTITAAGSPPEVLTGGTPTGGNDEDERWYKRMWLSNRDFAACFERAILADVPEEEPEGTAGPHRHARRGFLLLNATSKNAGAKWDLAETERRLGVVSEDDSLR